MKAPFDLETALGRIEEAIRPFPPAALFGLATAGFDSLFEQLVACIISVRSRDEVTVVAARRLFGAARSPADLARLTPEAIAGLIKPATFYEAKGHQIQAIARRAAGEFGGTLPCDASVLLSFDGVGPKCANLALGVACHQPHVSVDIHVHRVCNRWGYVQTRTPEQTMVALEAQAPRDRWIDLNRLLMPFGKHICTTTLPRCSTCPVLDMCRQVGVTQHR